MLISKWAAGATTSYRMFINSTGNIVLSWVTAAAATITKASTVIVPFADYAAGWVRATLDVDNGAAGNDVTFYTSTDGVTWTQLGTTVTTASATNIRDTASILEIGTDTTGTANMFAGIIYRAQIYNGIAGTLAFDANFALPAKLATSFTESSSNAATVTINATGDLGARIAGERDLVQMTASKRPVWLEHTGEKYAYLNGATGNALTSPDSAALDITSNIDLRCKVALNSWVPAAVQDLVSKYDGGINQRSYMLQIDTTGKINFWHSVLGTGGLVTQSTASVGAANYSAKWVRVAADMVAGLVNFYTSDDGASWTQLGTANVALAGGASSIFSGTAQLAIGSRSDGAELVSGKIYRAQVFNGIAGTLAFDFNPSSYTSGTTLTDASANAATITIQGGATIVTRTKVYGDGTDDYMKAPAFSLSQPETVYFVGGQTTWTITDVLYDGNSAASGSLIQTTATPQLNISAGSSVGAVTALAVKTDGVMTSVFNGASSANRLNRAAAVTGNAGASNMGGFTLLGNGSGAAIANATASEVIIYGAANDTADQDNKILALGAKHRITT